MPAQAPLSTVEAELEAARSGMETAVDAILTAAEQGLASAAALQDDDARVTIERLLFDILEACAFQDLTGQRLNTVARLLRGEAADALLEGPQRAGAGLDQGAADALMQSPPIA